MRSAVRFVNIRDFLRGVALILGGALPGSFALASMPLPPLATASQLPDLVEKLLPGVVNISSTTIVANPLGGWEDFLQGWGIPRERKQSSLGSGFLIDAEGLIVTNHHVVAHADEVVVTLRDKRSYPVKLVGSDQKMDVALLKIRDGSVKLSPVPLGDSEAVRIGESVVAIGNPFGLQHTVTAGIISAKNRTIGVGPFDNFLQTDASINPGNSGGPLFNLKGEVIGINTVIFSRTGQSGGLGFAIPIHEAKRLFPDLKKYGRVPRPWLGILGERLNPGLARYYRLGTDQGVVVYNLVRRGPADRAGLRQGDVIVAVESTEALEVQDVERAIARKKPRESVALQVQRGRRRVEIVVKLEELPRLDDLPQGIL